MTQKNLIVVRDNAFAGSMVKYQLFIDGFLVAKIGAGEHVELCVESGYRLIELKHPLPMIGAIGDSVEIQVHPSRKYAFRINSDLGIIRLLRTTTPQIYGNSNDQQNHK